MREIENEHELLRQLNAGDISAFERIFHVYYASLCYFAVKIVRDSETARDLVQEVFIGFWEKTTKFDTLVALRSYLYLCVQNKALNHVERETNRERIRLHLGATESDEGECDLHEIEAEIFEQIFTAIEELPVECGRVFKMSYFEQMDVKSISETLGVAASTVMTQRQRAKKMLRDRLRHIYKSLSLIFY